LFALPATASLSHKKVGAPIVRDEFVFLPVLCFMAMVGTIWGEWPMDYELYERLLKLIHYAPVKRRKRVVECEPMPPNGFKHEYLDSILKAHAEALDDD
jgi:hypothetical protein